MLEWIIRTRALALESQNIEAMHERGGLETHVQENDQKKYKTKIAY